MPRLSVVVPVYNVEDYLDDCLLSLDAQESHDFEAICVNDGSTDSSRSILERWAHTKSWLKVVDKENGGLSSARNAGIRAATGDYVCFLDSDDRLMPNACGRIIDAFLATDPDVLVYGGYALPREDTWKWLEHVLSPDDMVYEGFSRELVFGEKTRPFVWRTAARRGFLLGDAGAPVLFDEGVRYGEDLIFQFRAYALARKAASIHDRLYEYRVNRAGSLMFEARREDTDLLQANVEILRHVLRDCAELDLLEKCREPMLAWAVRFIAHDALMADSDRSAAILDQMADALRPYWSLSDVREANLEPPVSQTLEIAYLGKRVGTPQRKLLCTRLHYVFFWRGNVLDKIRDQFGT